MFADWLRGIQFIKAQRVASLGTVLAARNRSSIERKSSNISTVTTEQLDVYLEGYRPLRNIQGDLRRSVTAYLARNRRILELLEAHRRNALPPSLPVDTATEDRVVPPPTSRQSGSRARGGVAAGASTAVDDFRRRELAVGARSWS